MIRLDIYPCRYDWIPVFLSRALFWNKIICTYLYKLINKIIIVQKISKIEACSFSHCLSQPKLVL
jgi:hypothetical protein